MVETNTISLQDPSIFSDGQHMFYSLTFIDVDRQKVDLEDRSITQPIVSINVALNTDDDGENIKEAMSYNLYSPLSDEFIEGVFDNGEGIGHVDPVTLIELIGDVFTEEFSLPEGQEATVVHVPLYKDDHIIPFEDLSDQGRELFEYGKYYAQLFAGDQDFLDVMADKNTETSHDIIDKLNSINDGHPNHGTFITVIIPPSMME